MYTRCLASRVVWKSDGKEVSCSNLADVASLEERLAREFGLKTSQARPARNAPLAFPRWCLFCWSFSPSCVVLTYSFLYEKGVHSRGS